MGLSLSRLLLPDLVVTEFVEMRLVEVNGAGWCLQLVSNRRGPGHLIIRLLVARRRTNRSCRREARAENSTKKSRQAGAAASRAAGGHQLGDDAPGRAGPAYVPRLPLETRRAAAPGSAPSPTPAGWSPGPQREPLRVRAGMQPPLGPSRARSLAPAPLPRAAARAAGAGEGRAAGCRGRGGASGGRQRLLPRRAPPLGPGTSSALGFRGLLRPCLGKER